MSSQTFPSLNETQAELTKAAERVRHTLAGQYADQDDAATIQDLRRRALGLTSSDGFTAPAEVEDAFASFDSLQPAEAREAGMALLAMLYVQREMLGA